MRVGTPRLLASRRLFPPGPSPSRHIPLTLPRCAAAPVRASAISSAPRTLPLLPLQRYHHLQVSIGRCDGSRHAIYLDAMHAGGASSSIALRLGLARVGSLSYSCEAWLGVPPAHTPSISLGLRPASSRSGQAALLHGALVPSSNWPRGLLQAAHPPMPSQAPSPFFSLSPSKTPQHLNSSRLQAKNARKKHIRNASTAPSLLF